MAHYQQLKFVEVLSKYFPQYFNDVEVVEIGSWSEFGTIRKFFKANKFIGADVKEGPGVDIVCGGQDLDLPSESQDVAISCECFEHNPYWVETFNNMIRMLRPGGFLIMTCASLGRPEHGTTRSRPEASLTSQIIETSDYYQNLSQYDFEKAFNLDQIFSDFYFYQNPFSQDLYFLGIKKGTHESGKYHNQLKKLEVEVANIKKEKEISYFKDKYIRMIYKLKFYFILLIGDRKFRDMKYFVKRLI